MSTIRGRSSSCTPCRSGAASLFLVKYLVGAGAPGLVERARGRSLWWLELGLNPSSFARRQIRPELLALELGAVRGVLLHGGGLRPAAGLLSPPRLAAVRADLAGPDAAGAGRTRAAVPERGRALHLRAPRRRAHRALGRPGNCTPSMSALALALAARLWLGGQDRLPALLERWRTHATCGAWPSACGLVGAALAAGFAAVASLGGGPGRTAAGERASARPSRSTPSTSASPTSGTASPGALVAGEADRAYQRLQPWLPTPEMRHHRGRPDRGERRAPGPGRLGEAPARRARAKSPRRCCTTCSTTRPPTCWPPTWPRARRTGARPSLRFFMEGLAEYLAYELLGRDDGAPDRPAGRRPGPEAPQRPLARAARPRPVPRAPRRVPALRPRRGLGGRAGRELRPGDPRPAAAGLRRSSRPPERWSGARAVATGAATPGLRSDPRRRAPRAGSSPAWPPRPSASRGRPRASCAKKATPCCSRSPSLPPPPAPGRSSSARATTPTPPRPTCQSPSYPLPTGTKRQVALPRPPSPAPASNSRPAPPPSKTPPPSSPAG